jgi:hypothetical protein
VKVKTYTALKNMMENPGFQEQRQHHLRGLKEAVIDEPLVGLIRDMNRLSFCFTLQCCYGHFLFPGRDDPLNCLGLPAAAAVAGTRIEYRIAYIAFGIENNASGKLFWEQLKAIERIDPQRIQYGCADWFWRQQVNSYIIQVEPDRYKYQDVAELDYPEALNIEKRRCQFYAWLGRFLQRWDFTANVP